jgi:hypothetical protein
MSQKNRNLSYTISAPVRGKNEKKDCFLTYKTSLMDKTPGSLHDLAIHG